MKLDCFVNQGFLTDNECKELESLLQIKPTSIVIYDWRPNKCLFLFVHEKRHADYNFRYFKKSYFEFRNRKPFWKVEEINGDILKIIKEEQNNLINCLYESGLISKLSYSKIKEKAEEGVFYKIWEILTVAAQLTKNEEFYLSTDLDLELDKLVKLDILSRINLHKIKNDLLNKKINQTSEIFKKYNVGYTLQNDESTKREEHRIIFMLNYFLPKLPYYKEHKINSCEFILGNPHPILEGDFYNSCVLNLTFNDFTTSYPIKIDSTRARMNPLIPYLLAIKIIEFLDERYDSLYYPTIVVNTFFDNYNWQGDFESFTLIIARKNKKFGIDKNWFKHILPNWNPHMPQDTKDEYLVKLFKILDSSRLTETKKIEIHRNVFNSEIMCPDEIPAYVENLILTIWKDGLCESYPYKSVVESLIEITNNHVTNVKISETKKDKLSVINVEIKKRNFLIELYNGRMDYDFAKLIYELQTEIDLGGKFYNYSDENLEDGYSFIFLTHREKERLKEYPIFKVDEIETVENIWLKKD